ncbi:MAG TPA: DUF4190 domain-containing protein [Galbitalea sp.]|nr:DUF4190 domain-containing protein [Galbitalea sp.]
MAPPIPQPSVAPAQQAPPIYVPQPVYVAAPYYGRRTNGFAVASLIFGLLGGSVFAIIFGHVALGQIRRTGEGGSGMATVGLVFGYLWLIGVIIYVIVVAVAVSQL